MNIPGLGNLGDMKTYRFTANNIHCENCLGKIQQALDSIPGVANFVGDLENKSFTVQAPAAVNAEQIAGVVRSIGFEIEPV